MRRFSQDQSPSLSRIARCGLRQIAADFAGTGDLAQAQAALDKLNLANPAQLIVSLAEADMRDGSAPSQVAPLARLADALGAHNARLLAYVEPRPTAPPPSPTPSPAAAQPNRGATAPPTPTLTVGRRLRPYRRPQRPRPRPSRRMPRVVSDTGANVRSGPGRAYPITGKLQAGAEVEIVARNASGDWWQLALAGQPWVAGTVVRVLGPIDTVAVAQEYPATAAPAYRCPKPTAAPAQPPPPTAEYVVKSVTAAVRRRRIRKPVRSGDHYICVMWWMPRGIPWTACVCAKSSPIDDRSDRRAGQRRQGSRSLTSIAEAAARFDIVNEANNPMGDLTPWHER